jgi:hypothetical protein
MFVHTLAGQLCSESYALLSNSFGSYFSWQSQYHMMIFGVIIMFFYNPTDINLAQGKLSVVFPERSPSKICVI